MQLGDARKLDQMTLEALRHRAVLFVEKGATHLEAALAVGVHRGTISRWCGTYRRDGASGLDKGKRGQRAGDQLMLTALEARRVQGWIRDKMRDQMKLAFALWAAQAVRALIHKKFGNPQRIAAWREQDYPSIASRAKRENAVIHWSDETGVRDQDQIGRFGKSSGGMHLKARRRS